MQYEAVKRKVEFFSIIEEMHKPERELQNVKDHDLERGDKLVMVLDYDRDLDLDKNLVDDGKVCMEDTTKCAAEKKRNLCTGEIGVRVEGLGKARDSEE